MTVFERVQSASLATGSGPSVETFNVNLPDSPPPLLLEAWISNFGGSNVHIFEGNLSVADCQGRLDSGVALADMLLTVTGSGPVRRRLPDNVSTLTIFFEAQNNSGQFQIATVRVTSHRASE